MRYSCIVTIFRTFLVQSLNKRSSLVPLHQVGKLERHKLYKLSKLRRSPKEAEDGGFRWLQTTRDTKFTEVDIENYEPFLSVRVGEHRLQGTALGFGKLNAYK